MLAERAALRAAHTAQCGLLRIAHDLLGVETFTPISELPTRAQRRAAIVDVLGSDTESNEG